MRQVRRSVWRNERGATLVEFAMVLPLLALFFVGIVDFGMILREHEILQNAAREGARFSAMTANSISGSSDPAATESAIQNRVVKYLQQENISISSSRVMVNQAYVISVAGTTVTGSEVTVSYSKSQFIGGSLFGPFTMTARSVFRNFY
jgi:Flp pilus assembly protein TadG